MAQPNSRSTAWVKRTLSLTGFAVFLLGLHWLWQLRGIWPRAASDFVQQPLLEAIGVIIAGLYLVSRGR